MKAGELTAELLRELSVIEEDEALMKKALNYGQGTEKIVKGDIWTPAAGWQQMETDGRYAAVKKESAAFRGLERLRAIVKGYQYWLNRYRVDSTQPANAKKDEKASK